MICHYEDIVSSHRSCCRLVCAACETADSETCSFLRKQHAHHDVTCLAIEVVYLVL
jgi:hypothetical protein